MIKRAIQHRGVYLHCFPNYNQAKRAIWKSVHEIGDGDSMAYLDHIPPELIKNKNSSEMTIELINGSIYCVLGVDGKNAQRARGMNPSGVIMSEYAFMDEEAWRTIEPRVAQNNGFAIFISTPNGQNHFYNLYNHAKANPDRYYSSLVTVEDAGTLDPSYLDKLRGEGVPEDFIQQEYQCSFTRGAEGSYYGKLIQRARDEGRICELAIDRDLPVYTSWDIGFHDSTCIWWFQIKPNGTYNFIDYYENHGEGLRHYIDKLNEFKEKNKIIYASHYVPHDMGNGEFSSGDTRLNTAREFGYHMTILERKPVADGIQAVRSILNNSYFDGQKCKFGLQCLDFYRKKWNDALKVYYDTPLHDKWSHGCFVGETKIALEHGEKPISEIQIGDFVLTPNGLKKVLNKFEYDSDKLLDVVTSHSILTCTHNHKIFTTKSLTHADSLRYNDILFSLNDRILCQKKFGSCSVVKDLGWRENFLSVMTENLSYSMAFSSEKMEHTIEEKMDLCTGMYGCTTTALYQKASIFTILMEILKITQKKISNLFPLQNIAECTGIRNIEKKCHERPSELLWKRLRNGTHLKKEGNGINKMEKNVSLSVINSLVNVPIVEFASKVTGLMQNFVTLIASRGIVQKVKKTTKNVFALFAKKFSELINGVPHLHVVKIVQHKDKCIQKVYDIEVEDDHCYYANGILVSNSDSFRYACMGIKTYGHGGGSSDDDFKAIDKYFGR